MTKLLMTGDLHLSANPRDDYRFQFLKTLTEMAQELVPDRIIIAGDLTEEKDKHPAVLVNRIIDALGELAEIAPLVALEGNHDYKEEGNAFFQFISHIKRMRWVSQPEMFPWNGRTLLLPHTNNWKRDWKHLMLNGWDCDTIICHQTVESANVGFGRKLEGIPPSTFDGVSSVFAGDIHVPQSIGKNFHYIGAPYTVDFGDEYISRVIMLKGDHKRFEDIDTSMFPQKRMLSLGPGDTSIRGQTFNDGDVCKIKVHVDDMGGWPTLRDQIRKDAEKRGVVVWSISPLMTKRVIRRRHKVEDQDSDQEVLEAFGKRHSLSRAQMKTGMKLL